MSIPDPERYVDSTSDERVVNNTVSHQYRVLSETEKRIMGHIKDAGLQLIREIGDISPSSREALIAVEKVEEAVMWAIKGLVKD